MRTPLLLASLFLCSSSVAVADTPPDQTRLGIGVSWHSGWLVDTGIIPHTGSLRLRLENGLVLEPSVGFIRERTNGDGFVRHEADAFAASLGARIPVARRSSAELQLLAATSVGTSRFEDNNGWEAESVGASLSWGLGIEWFASSQLSIGADAMSSIANVSQRDDEYGDSWSISWGPVLNPQVTINATLYF